MNALYCVVFRLGSPDNYSWHRTRSTTLVAAQLAARDISQHFRCHVASEHVSILRGLPTSWEGA
jgi:hypothetical protein